MYLLIYKSSYADISVHKHLKKLHFVFILVVCGTSKSKELRCRSKEGFLS